MPSPQKARREAVLAEFPLVRQIEILYAQIVSMTTPAARTPAFKNLRKAHVDATAAYPKTPREVAGDS
jgi:hypothetical protein